MKKFYLISIFLLILFSSFSLAFVEGGDSGDTWDDDQIDAFKTKLADPNTAFDDPTELDQAYKNGFSDQLRSRWATKAFNKQPLDKGSSQFIKTQANSNIDFIDEVAIEVIHSLDSQDYNNLNSNVIVAITSEDYADFLFSDEGSAALRKLAPENRQYISSPTLLSDDLKHSAEVGQDTVDFKEGGTDSTLIEEAYKENGKDINGIANAESIKSLANGDVQIDDRTITANFLKDGQKITITPEGKIEVPEAKVRVNGQIITGAATIDAKTMDKDAEGNMILTDGSIKIDGHETVNFKNAILHPDGTIEILDAENTQTSTPDGSTASFSGFDSFTSSLSSTRVTNSAAGSLSNQNFIIKYEDIENLTYENEILTITKAKYLTITQNDKTATLVNAENVTITPYQTTADHADSLTQEATIAANLDQLELTKTLCFESADTLIIGTRGYNALGESCFLYYGPEIRKADATSLENENYGNFGKAVFGGITSGVFLTI